MTSHESTKVIIFPNNVVVSESGDPFGEPADGLLGPGSEHLLEDTPPDLVLLELLGLGVTRPDNVRRQARQLGSVEAWKKHEYILCQDLILINHNGF